MDAHLRVVDQNLHSLAVSSVSDQSIYTAKQKEVQYVTYWHAYKRKPYRWKLPFPRLGRALGPIAATL